MSILPEGEASYLEHKGLTFSEVTEGNQHGVVLKDFRLPPGKYDAEVVDLLILLPPGFPDAPPDMFYVFPWIKLREGDRYPRAADAAHRFAGISWQRWSRHSSEWRPGRDGLASFMTRINHAIETASA